MTQEIVSKNGYISLVDDADFIFAKQWEWSYNPTGSRGFTRQKRVNGKVTHITLTNEIAKRANIIGKVIDHKNRDCLDNRRENLRGASYTQNNYNNDLQINNTTGFIGVSLEARTSKWRMRIRVNGREISLTGFNTAEEAAKKRDSLAKRFHGDFAVLNFPRKNEL